MPGITRPAYCRRGDAVAAGDAALSRTQRNQIDQVVCAASGIVDGDMNRVFYPWQGTRYFRWPDPSGANGWRLWLEENELISLTALTAGGTSLDVVNDVFLEPQQSGPPYSAIEVDLGSSAAFSSANTPQRAIAVTGTFGYQINSTTAGTLSATINSTQTSAVLSVGGIVGPGDLIIIGTEYMLVTDVRMSDSGAVLATPMTADASNTSLAVADGTLFTEGETLQLDSESMVVDSITGNTLTVQRAAFGTVLATHTGSAIYSARTLTVQRGYGGTTGATHLSTTAVSRFLYPPEISVLTLAYAQAMLSNIDAAWARPAGQAGKTMPQPAGSIGELRDQVFVTHGRTNGPWAV